MDIRAERDRRAAAALELARDALAGEVLGGNRPDRFLFVTVSGAHIYGFPSADSDLDLRGAHVLPLRRVIGLAAPRETYESLDGVHRGVEVDCVTHDVGKYLRLLTGRNGYILEQVLSPLVVYDEGSLGELRELARGAITRHVVHHYRGFFRSQEKLLAERPTVKAALYLLRVAMSGLHLLRTREVVTDILRLNDEVFRLPFVDELVERKLVGREKGELGEGERDALLADARQLEAQLEPAAEESGLPDKAPNLEAIDEYLVRVRLEGEV